ncbi:MAG: UDP-3-O-acyl-N-acetylglucosamine deacetylase [Oscillatoriales cyanobacterium SM2_2_1]|nr:UDP-3-O-acyl-N-acetylglucosamine deacetylase [Oscillatoriales cyanobacterium SM2_2_1]
MARRSSALALVRSSSMGSQHTIARAVHRHGIGLHTGQESKVTLHPAPPHTGRVFRRGEANLPATVAVAIPSQLSTLLTHGELTVRTPEHLLSALAGLEIDNVWIDLEGPEIPILDGSALPWVNAILEAGRINQSIPKTIRPITQPITIWEGDAFVSAIPSPEVRLTYGIEFDSAAIGTQWVSWSPSVDGYIAAIAPARTFTLAKYLEPLRAAGLIQGGSLNNAIVCDDQHWLNPPLRFELEPCRHKLLDLIGDLSLLGALPQGHIVAYKASHTLHSKFAQAVQLQCPPVVDNRQ